ncbi:uncharacterized protein BJ212DRAFT_1258168 [Suillus subaureus]|uniref:BTB domain-containing protein n=1 Tax=Suillus subaureus TaxID=48587 RepID=A0A9P7EPM0_9AGAM|nr:uncharacterized protein BJ212DRAFT_1258168 [Suillus subaureus]KAG1827640.1 hypothetical protein BJ212DRAFT_1258168 [Suillus subaureus]
MTAEPHNVRQHPTYWFNDGSLVIRSRSMSNGEVCFKLHESLLRRQSRFVQRMLDSGTSTDSEVLIPPELGVQVQDFTALLEHLYHDIPLSAEAPFSHVAAILRVSSSNQLDLPGVHMSARAYFVSMFPQGPQPFAHPSSHLTEALALVQSYQIPLIRKGIYYSLVTTSEFEPEDDELDLEIFIKPNGLPGSSPTPRLILPPTDVERCRSLMTGIVEHFTPVLFTPPATPHMACTDVFADKWMTLVIAPAISNSGVCKPLEMLEQVKQIDWAAEGLCAACVREKTQEWTQEQEDVWEKMDLWLNPEGTKHSLV